LSFSALLVAASVGLFLTKGLSYGIDFTGGIMIEVKTPSTQPNRRHARQAGQA